MKEEFYALLFLLTSVALTTQYEECKTRFLSKPTAPSRLDFNATQLTLKIKDRIELEKHTFINVSRDVLRHKGIFGIILSDEKDHILSLNISNRLRVFPNRTTETQVFWTSFNVSETGWTPIFKECYFTRKSWYYGYVAKLSGLRIGLFVKVLLNQCDTNLVEIFGQKHQCDEESTECSRNPEMSEKGGGYHCRCRQGFFYPKAHYSWRGFSGEDIESGFIDSPRCSPCHHKCDYCGLNGVCLAKRNGYWKTIILSINLGCIGVSIVLAIIVFKQRKIKAIASGMWTILEIILLGVCLMYLTIVVKIFEPSTLQCIIEPWAREVGFIICYGSIILKLYRHLIEFRTRKAHRWVVKDTDLLKYLLVMTMSVLAYMAAYTAVTLNFMQENYSLLFEGVTNEGLHYQACKPLWWDFVTESGELIILIFGIHLSYASRNARTQFHERTFLCAAISIELAVSTLFYGSRLFIFPGLHPDYVLLFYSIRIQLTTTSTMLLVFVPKFWYQQKQVQSLGQEYSCRIPVDAFKDMNAHGPLTGNNSDVDVGEVTLADMSPDDIRAELKRLYLQLEIYKSKTMCRDNPHISKRRGGRKAAHRRFSLQNLHGKRARKLCSEENTEAEPSRTPEESVCSIEGPSGIYSELLSNTHISDQK